MTASLFLGLTDDRKRPTDVPGRATARVARPHLTGAPEPQRLTTPSSAEPASQFPARPVYLTKDQRDTGMHVIGGPGSGKSKFLEHCIRQDLDAWRGVGLIDWHGPLYDGILSYCAAIRLERQIIPLNLSSEYIVGFDPFSGHEGEANTLANLAIAALTKAWGMLNTDDTPTLESVARCIFHAIVESRLTIAETEHFLSYDDRAIRDYLASHIRNPAILKEWREITTGTRREWREEWRSTRSKLLRFVSARPLLRFMGLAQSIDLRRIMDEEAVLLVNLRPAPGVLDEQDARVFGAMLVTKFFYEARRRIRRDGTDPPPFYLYCDEFQNFVSPDVPNVLAEGRKMGLSLTLAHQYLGQLKDEDQRLVRAVMGAVRTRVVFGLEDPEDAAALVPSVFRGLIDYHEVKRIDYSVKLWPVYDRDRVITDGTNEVDATGRMKGRGDVSGSGAGTGNIAGATFVTAAGHQLLPDGTFGPSFESSIYGINTGRIDQSNRMAAHSEFDADSVQHAEGRTHAISDVPIYRPVPYLEGTEKEWSLEEQKHRLADVLLLQLQRYCWVKPREGLALPVAVPILEDYPLPPEMVFEYEAEQALKTGALSAQEADSRIASRRQLLEHDSQAYFDQRETPDVHSLDDARTPSAPDEPISLEPRPTRPPFSKPGRKPGSKRTVPTEPK